MAGYFHGLLLLLLQLTLFFSRNCIFESIHYLRRAVILISSLVCFVSDSPSFGFVGFSF